MHFIVFRKGHFGVLLVLEDYGFLIYFIAIAKQKKKLKKAQIKNLDEAVNAILANPDVGDLKKGDLEGIRVYKYKVGNNLILLVYEIEGSTLFLYSFGSHQNFYRELRKYLHQ